MWIHKSSIISVWCVLPLFFSSFCDHSNVNKLWAHQGKCILGVFIDLINEEQEFETMFDKSSLNMLKNLKPLWFMNSKSEINKIKNPLINYFLAKRFLKCHNFYKSKFINKRLNTGQFGFHFHTRIIMCRNKKGYLKNVSKFWLLKPTTWLYLKNVRLIFLKFVI